ncbi:hypothetical protein [Methylovirgula sp. HY1]|uniref:hypothetical protein n=1 Tax=Methylovirgula sp. HY1 TaxID=2822761 RepID=UPI002106923F|nr:hypothetical protein [Methylovirgula sp. HY1]
MVISAGRIVEIAVSKALQQLLEAAKKAEPSPAQREEQRRSFAYGNTAFENKLITREMIDRQAAIIARERDEQLKQ